MVIQLTRATYLSSWGRPIGYSAQERASAPGGAWQKAWHHCAISCHFGVQSLLLFLAVKTHATVLSPRVPRAL